MTPSITDAVAMSDDKTQSVYAEAVSESVKENKIQILIEMAQGLHKQPQSAKELRNAVSLYYRAYQMSGEDYPLLKARSQVGMASALQAIPDVDSGLLLQAKIAYEEALPILQELATPEEIAAAKMNLGLVLQSLAPFHLARITDSIQAYQEALQVFTWEQYPQKYTILHKNIAIAYLSMSTTSEQQSVQQGLAIQTLETALQHIHITEHPGEYAMLQSNLGNAWQYLPGSNSRDNLTRAIAAYDQALKVHDPQDNPLEYANIISHKANALFKLPDDVANPQNLQQAHNYYQQALSIFTTYKQVKQAEIIDQAMQEVDRKIMSTP